MTSISDNGRNATRVIRSGALSPEPDPPLAVARERGRSVPGSKSGGGRRRVIIESVSPGRMLLISLFMGIVYGVVAFIVLMLLSWEAERVGLVSSINSLMGEAMTITWPSLMILAASMSIVITIISGLILWMKGLMLNTASVLLGGLRVTVTEEGESR